MTATGTAAPEQQARRVIDAALTAAGWIVQDRAEVNLHAGLGVAVRETPTATGPTGWSAPQFDRTGGATVRA